MKLRLTQKGFEHYNGQMGVIWFVDGLSTADVTNNDARRMSASMLCEWEDGTSANVAQALLDNAETKAPMFKVGAEQHDADAANKAEVAQLGSDKPKTSKWAREELEKIADEKGIKGLRAIADPLGIKGASIRELIAELSKDRAGAEPQF